MCTQGALSIYSVPLGTAGEGSVPQLASVHIPLKHIDSGVMPLLHTVPSAALRMPLHPLLPLTQPVGTLHRGTGLQLTSLPPGEYLPGATAAAQ